MNVSAPLSGPHSKSISGQWTAILGKPGKAPRTISSMLGCVAAVSATESPSHDSPALIQRMWMGCSSVCFLRHASRLITLGEVVERAEGQLPQRVVEGRLGFLDAVHGR